MQNGRYTYRESDSFANSYDHQKPQIQSNSWTATENSSNNAWNVNFNNGNTNANNKYNSNVVRPVSALCPSKEFLQSVIDAFHDCCRGKMSSRQCIDYLAIAEEDLPRLADELWNNTYEIGTSTCFLVSYPKWREVFAADFRDRIVHHWLIYFLNSLFEQRFCEQGNVSYNCRKGYGTFRAVNDTAKGVARVSDNYKKPAYVFRGDMVGFFMSIDQDVMWSLLRPFLDEKLQSPWKDIIMRTLRKVVFHRPEQNCVLNTDPSKWHNLSCNKSLFRTPPHKGMPIGNLTTQILANFYMSFFDAYVLQAFQRQNYYYIRFVDDFLICCDNDKFLKSQIPLLRNYLHSTLHINLHHDKHYHQPLSHGFAFVGAYIKPHRIYTSNRTRARLIERIHGFNAILNSPISASSPSQPSSAVPYPDLITLSRIETVINSYLGFTKGRSAYKLRSNALRLFSPAFFIYFYITTHHLTIHLKHQYRI